MRHLLNTQILAAWGGTFPAGILAVNVLGCLIMGIAAGILAQGSSAELRAFLTTGVLGGFTTFSAFAYDAVFLAEGGRLTAAVGYVAGSVILSIIACALGLWLARWVVS